MRLLNFENFDDTNEFRPILCEYFDQNIPPYAILSHRWGHPNDEVSYYDILRPNQQAPKKKGYRKLELVCKQAARDGLKHAWVDTCCINKDSSAELTEAINSMFLWYRRSTVCYAYLIDVSDSHEDPSLVDSPFRNSEWFTRGWTLQELIAPLDVRFYSANWIEIGQKSDLSKVLYEITGIPEEVLRDPLGTLKDVCAAQKMSWASDRRTSRIEDRAYSLIGIFDVSLPIMYGEGLRSYTRLQEEIIRYSFDHSIFAWYLKGNCSGLLATTPDDFACSGNVRQISARDYTSMFGLDKTRSDYTVTNIGLNIQLPRRKLKSHVSVYVAFLACHFEGRQNPIFIYIKKYSGGLRDQFYRCRKSTRSIGDSIEFVTQLGRSNFSKQDKIWMIEPERSRIGAIRPLLHDELALQSLADVRASNAYHICLFHQGKIKEMYPIADDLTFNEATIETDSNKSSIALVKLRSDCEVYIVLAVIDGDLMIHMKLRDTSDSESIEAVYDGLLSSSELPSSQLELPSALTTNSSPETHDNADGELVSIIQEIFFTQTPCRKVFSLLLRVGARADLYNRERRVSLATPKVWHKSVGEMLRRCTLLGDGTMEELRDFDPSRPYSCEVDYGDEHSSNEDPVSEDLGERGGNLLGLQEISVDDSKMFNSTEEWQSNVNVIGAMETELDRDTHHGNSEDSRSFNAALASGYAAAYSQACKQLDGIGNSNVDVATFQSRDYAYGFADGYGRTVYRQHIVQHVHAMSNTDIPKATTARVMAHAEGYRAGYVAGHASAVANKGGKAKVVAQEQGRSQAEQLQPHQAAPVTDQATKAQQPQPYQAIQDMHQLIETQRRQALETHQIAPSRRTREQRLPPLSKRSSDTPGQAPTAGQAATAAKQLGKGLLKSLK